MFEKSENSKRTPISEEDISALLPRYPAATIIKLLQEVAQLADTKIDWDALVKKTTTGISSAREYHQLWRHLAYRHSLPGNIDDATEPLDDESDLECEPEAFPPVSSESSAEAAAFARVLIASASQTDSSVSNGSCIEAPLIINIPNGQFSRDCPKNSQANITIPVIVQKQPTPSMTIAEPSDTNGLTNNQPPRKRRKPWSNEEDMQLIDAVKKCGEGNWSTVLKGNFKGDRTASQLSQRWLLIKKRNNNLNPGVANSNGSQPSEAQLAARQAMFYALDDMPKRPTISKFSQMLPASTTEGWPMGGGISKFHGQPQQILAPTSQPLGGSTSKSHFQPEQVFPTATSQMPACGGTQCFQQAQPPPPPAPSKSGALAATPSLRLSSKRTVSKPTYSPDSMVKAAAVAAGARIATQNEASLLKSASTVRIMGPGKGSLIKSSLPGCPNPVPPMGSTGMNYVCATPLALHPPHASATTSSVHVSIGHTSKVAPPPKKSPERTDLEASGSMDAPRKEVHDDPPGVSDGLQEDHCAVPNPDDGPCRSNEVKDSLEACVNVSNVNTVDSRSGGGGGHDGEPAREPRRSPVAKKPQVVTVEDSVDDTAWE